MEHEEVDARLREICSLFQQGAARRCLEEAERLGGICLDLRPQDVDPVSAVQCASTVCEMLHRLGRDDLNTRFARFLIEARDAIAAVE